MYIFMMKRNLHLFTKYSKNSLLYYSISGLLSLFSFFILAFNNNFVLNNKNNKNNKIQASELIKEISGVNLIYTSSSKSKSRKNNIENTESL